MHVSDFFLEHAVQDHVISAFLVLMLAISLFYFSEYQNSLAAGLGSFGGVMLLLGAAILGVWVYIRCRRAAAPRPQELEMADFPPQRPPAPVLQESATSEGTEDSDPTPTMTPLSMRTSTPIYARTLSTLLTEAESFTGGPLPPKRTGRGQRRD